MEFNQYLSQYYDYNVHGSSSLHWCSRCPSSTKWVSTSLPLPPHSYQQVYPTPPPSSNTPFLSPVQIDMISTSINTIQERVMELAMKMKETNPRMLSSLSQVRSQLHEMQLDSTDLDDANVEEAKVDDAMENIAAVCISEYEPDLIEGNSPSVDKVFDENRQRNITKSFTPFIPMQMSLYSTVVFPNNNCSSGTNQHLRSLPHLVESVRKMFDTILDMKVFAKIIFGSHNCNWYDTGQVRFLMAQTGAERNDTSVEVIQIDRTGDLRLGILEADGFTSGFESDGFNRRVFHKEAYILVMVDASTLLKVNGIANTRTTMVSASCVKVPLIDNGQALDIEVTCDVFDNMSSKYKYAYSFDLGYTRRYNESRIRVLIMDGITLMHRIKCLQLPFDPGVYDTHDVATLSYEMFNDISSVKHIDYPCISTACVVKAVSTSALEVSIDAYDFLRCLYFHAFNFSWQPYKEITSSHGRNSCELWLIEHLNTKIEVPVYFWYKSDVKSPPPESLLRSSNLPGLIGCFAGLPLHSFVTNQFIQMVYGCLANPKLACSNDTNQQVGVNLSFFISFVCGLLNNAPRIFYASPTLALLSFTPLITTYVLLGQGEEAMKHCLKLQNMDLTLDSFMLGAVTYSMVCLLAIKNGTGDKWNFGLVFVQSEYKAEIVFISSLQTHSGTNGLAFSPEVLAQSEMDLDAKFAAGLVFSQLMTLVYFTVDGVPHVLTYAYMTALVFVTKIKYSFHESEKVLECLKDSSKFVAASPLSVAVYTPYDAQNWCKPIGVVSKIEGLFISFGGALTSSNHVLGAKELLHIRPSLAANIEQITKEELKTYLFQFCYLSGRALAATYSKMDQRANGFTGTIHHSWFSEPFRVLLVCTTSKCSCLEELVSILELMMVMHSYRKYQDNDFLMFNYGQLLERLKCRIIFRVTSQLSGFSVNRLQPGIIFELEALGIDRQWQYSDMSFLKNDTAERVKPSFSKKNTVFDPGKMLCKVKGNIFLEWYKKVTMIEGGYYGSSIAEESTSKDVNKSREEQLFLLLPVLFILQGFEEYVGVLLLEAGFINFWDDAQEFTLSLEETRDISFINEGSIFHYGQMVADGALRHPWNALEPSGVIDVLIVNHAVAEFITHHQLMKQGVTMVPTDFGMSVTSILQNQTETFDGYQVFDSNLEDKVLFDDGRNVMNVTKLEDPFGKMANYVWDPGKIAYI